MNFDTRISDGEVVRGYQLKELIGKLSFTEMTFLVLTGRLPKVNERSVLDAMFVAAAEHSVAVPSILSARIVASAGNSLNAAVAAGILSIGEFHGGAIERCAKLLQESKIAERTVDDALSKKERLPGFGHKVYDKDPRVVQLLEVAQKEKVAGKFAKLALEMDDALCRKTGKTLHLNIDGAMAAILSDLGVGWKMAKAFFIIPRTVGICAHACEEQIFEKPYRRLEDNEWKYIGEKK